MNTRAAEQLFYDSEATLRLVDTLLDELQVMEAEGSRMEDRVRALSAHAELTQEDLAGLPDLLQHAQEEVRGLLEGVRQSRQVLELTTMEKLQDATDEHAEVPSVSELRDGLGRALALVARLGTGADPAVVHAELRGELGALLASVRAHEITEQQLSYASGVLSAAEDRLSQLAESFHGHGGPSLDPVRLRALERSAPDDPATSRQGLAPQQLQIHRRPE